MENLLGDADLREHVEFSLVNTTRRAGRAAGRATFENARNVVADALRVGVAARKVDVVHVQTALLPSLPLLRAVLLCAAARTSGAAVVCHVHSGRLNSGREEAFQPSTTYRVLLHVLGATVDRMIAVAEPGRVALRASLPATPVTTVHNAVDVATFDVASPDAPGAWPVYVGTLSRRKGLEDLVDALALARARGNDIELDVVGGGHEVGEEEAGRLRDVVARSGLTVRLHGSLDAAGVRDALHRASCFVLPSHWEGQPIAIDEAMASGLPVVVTAVGANPDVVRHGVDGFVVPSHDVSALADALERLHDDPELRRRMGTSARQRAEEELDLPVLRSHLLDEYAAAARARPRRAPRVGGSPPLLPAGRDV
ncbi:glycosyltransferase family 4 protein [Kineococcus rubinsiae]|uniref:glycosyltransferase family 4 protein n=1 Tax=Kineococcus rubinsiae TaxID=2609562 RepID=UPI00143159CB|nr:glycosyltransferase family 4 protein [Kineococcus rubinsiae]